jgi:FkbM family methyltransferase
MHNGIKVFTDSHYGDFNVEVIRKLRGHHEPQEEAVFEKVLQQVAESSTMIELGSFWAYYSMWFKNRVPNSKCYMLEPMTLQRGIDNFKLNNLDGTEFVEAAIGETTREIDFTHWDGTRHKMPQWSVDEFMSSRSIARLGILHADIQGAELAMLQGCKRSLAAGVIDFVFISTHGMKLHRRCENFLRGFRFNTVAVHTPAQGYAVDGLIVACREGLKFPQVQISRRLSAKHMLYAMATPFCRSA